MQLKMLRIRDVKLPERVGRNAGFDFFVPEDQKGIVLKPGKSCNIPSGIKVRLEPNRALIAFNKSGIASKYGLQVGACVVDENYTGEIHLNMQNCSKANYYIDPGRKIVQFLYIRVGYADVVECFTEKEMYEGFDIQERGDQGFGSTGL